MISGIDPGRELARIKDFLRRSFDNAGYSDTPWRAFNYDEWSTWFYFEKESEILSVMRIVEKKPYNIIPLENAVIYNEAEKFPHRRYAVIEEKVADWNSLAFVHTYDGWRAARETFKAVAKFCVQKQFSIIYGMYPRALKSIGLFYKKFGAHLSHRFYEDVYYPGLYLKGELCVCSVVEIEKKLYKRLRQNHRKRVSKNRFRKFE
ncbi:hypothetical protein LEP1GSC133_0761 [Leptospira borgpetersenii serovar Pomona str. 200901868]|uniref:N-acetyltransferase domain-containing protein n=1 Tax=Leptospira borgpetersenii serovar Pomona str. 200901868 TaxID=1192866 RepID=M6W7W7_LEPBO|nr:hypothetical protein LEP1GSC133_0761 [Leptospira borgpetersenii serovar Pomona str. 200901868]